MSQLERVYEMDRRLRNPPLRKRDILEKFEISEAQFKRDLEYIRNRLGAPVLYDRDIGGYRYGDEALNLPGLWFSSSEVHALLAMEVLLEQLQPGLVRDELGPFAAKLRSLIQVPPFGAEALRQRVRVVSTPLRPVDPACFRTVASATLDRKKLWMRYFTRHRGQEGERTVSPHHLIYHRGNWYLDAWCHKHDEVRRFALDAIREARMLAEPAYEPPGAGESGQEGYGIFAGKPQATAVLLFDATAARWVGHEEWHAQQISTPLPDGGLRLEVPYSLPQEIMMDILRHGAHVEVLAPQELRDAVAAAHHEAAARYEKRKHGVGRAGAARPISGTGTS